MLLRLTSSDIRNTTFVDCASGATVYTASSKSPNSRSKSRSTASFASFASSSSSSSRERLSPTGQVTTSLHDWRGDVVAEITWEQSHASLIRIGEETLAGTGELFDAAFVKVLPDETLLPTRMGYVWRISPESLALLDDDGEVVGTFRPKCVHSQGGETLPALPLGSGNDYLELDDNLLEDMAELIVTYILVSTLQESMFSITRYVYGQEASLVPWTARSSMNKLRRRATRSLARIRESLRRTMIS